MTITNVGAKPNVVKVGKKQQRYGTGGLRNEQA